MITKIFYFGRYFLLESRLTYSNYSDRKLRKNIQNQFLKKYKRFIYIKFEKCKQIN